METPPRRQDTHAAGRRAAVPQVWDPDRPDIQLLLEQGDVAAMELLPSGSNYTFLVRLTSEEAGESLAVYKPQRGEAPLWDFPDGTLYLREFGAYLVSRALGWPAIPPAVIRDGPHGVGTVQLYIDHNPRAHYFTFGGGCIPEVQRLALFDAITNNADRKAGHCLQDPRGKVWSIDHGLTFHNAYKLRTVIWDFQGRPIPDDLLGDLQHFRERMAQPDDPLVETLGQLITSAELQAFRRRVDTALTAGVFPSMGPHRNTPWPQM